MARRIESLFLAGAAGRLEALLEEPEEGEPVECALVCHPHPQFGGTMHNKVVYRLARGLRRTGCVVLRFNYRGVNLSEGAFGDEVGEIEDARVALAELSNRYSALPVLTAGFSFGSRIALSLTADQPSIKRVIAVGFPTRWPDREFAYRIQVPKYFVQSTVDEYGPMPEMEQFYASLPSPKHIDWIPAQNHFFKESLDSFEAVIERIGNLRAELS